MSGFQVESLDEEEYTVGKSRGEIIIKGINVPTNFTSYDFNYVGTKSSG
jgi:hypothetical protein